MELQHHFEQVRRLIRQGQTRALQAAYAEQLSVYWQVGAYVYHRLEASVWGDKVVNQLAAWLKESGHIATIRFCQGEALSPSCSP